jgi:hypothetical protein
MKLGHKKTTAYFYFYEVFSVVRLIEIGNGMVIDQGLGKREMGSYLMV